jgi:hypothetical protein
MTTSELLQRLLKNPFVRLRPERIQTRAYFLFQNRTGHRWWDPVSNWLEAELQELAEFAHLLLVAQRIPGDGPQDPLHFERHYDRLVVLRHVYDQPNVRPQKLGTKQPRRCSLCGQGAPEATFRKVAHIIPQALGNRSIVTLDECDACNERWGRELDQELAAMLQPDRVISMVPISQAPSAKASLARGRSSIGGQKRGAPLRVEVVKDDPSVSLSFEDEKTLSLKFPPVKFYPLSAVRSLAKMVWQALPEERRTHYSELRRLVVGEIEIVPAKLYLIFLPGLRLPFVDLTVWERTSSNQDLPELIAQLSFGTTVVIWSLPDFASKRYLDAVLPLLPLSPKAPHVPRCIQRTIPSNQQVTVSGSETTFAFSEMVLLYHHEPVPVTLVVDRAGVPPLRVSAELKTPTPPQEETGPRATYHLEGGHLAGRIELESDSTSARWRRILDAEGRDPGHVRETLELFLAMDAGASFQVVATGTGDELFRYEAGPGAQEPDEGLVQALEIACALEALNIAFGVQLSFPATLSAQEARVVALLHAAVQHGVVNEVPPDGRLPLVLGGRKMVEQFVEMLSEGPRDIEIEVGPLYNLQGVPLDPGPTLLRFKAARLEGTPEELRAQLKDWGDEEPRPFMLLCEQVVHVFRRWLPADAAATGPSTG